MGFIKIVLLFLSIIILMSIAWRFLSDRVSIPCPSWLYWLVELDNPFAKVCHAQSIVDFLHLLPEMNVLDVGCGSGRVTIALAEKLDNRGLVTAMDIQQGMLDSVKQKAKAKKLNNIRLLHAGIGEGVLEHNYYDRAILSTVLGEIPKQHRREALKEIYDALKSDGILSISEMIFDPHFQSKNTVLALAKEVGFREKKYFGRWFAYTVHLEK